MIEYFINIDSQLGDITTDVRSAHYLQNTYNQVAIKINIIDE